MPERKSHGLPVEPGRYLPTEIGTKIYPGAIDMVVLDVDIDSNNRRPALVTVHSRRYDEVVTYWNMVNGDSAMYSWTKEANDDRTDQQPTA